MIYFVQAGGRTGPVKVGYASDMGRRINSLRSGHHKPIRVIATQEGERADEARFHKSWAAHRIRGEWYKCEGVIADFVRCSPPHKRFNRVLDRAKRVPAPQAREIWLDQTLTTREALKRLGIGWSKGTCYREFGSCERPCGQPKGRWKRSIGAT